MAGPLGRDGQSVKLARQPHREIADVDHLLHFAEAFLQNFSVLDRDQTAERFFVGTQFLAEQTHQFATARRRHLAPLAERFHARFDLGIDRWHAVITDAPDLSAVDRRAHDLRSRRRDAEFGQKMGVHERLHEDGDSINRFGQRILY